MWLIFALLSAVFAAATSILAKIGIEGVNSNLATAIRTVVVVVMAWGMVFLTNAQGGIAHMLPPTARITDMGLSSCFTRSQGSNSGFEHLRLSFF